MSWIKKEVEVEVAAELEFNNTNITESNAYEVKITEAYLQKSADETSQSVSMVISVETEDGSTARSFFTIMGRDGNTYFTSTHKGKTVKKQHFGLNIVNSLFEIALGKEIFDVEPEDMVVKKWNKEEKEMEDTEVSGFPALVGKTCGVCVQMIRELKGVNSREYPEIKHFFDNETGLFANENKETKKRKLDIWLGSKKEFHIIEKEDTQSKSSFGKKDAATEPKKSKWGR